MNYSHALIDRASSIRDDIMTRILLNESVESIINSLVKDINYSYQSFDASHTASFDACAKFVFRVAFQTVQSYLAAELRCQLVLLQEIKALAHEHNIDINNFCPFDLNSKINQLL